SLTSRLTVGEWLDMWLASKKTRKTTTNGYESHVRVHLKPRIGHIRPSRLNVGHLAELVGSAQHERARVVGGQLPTPEALRGAEQGLRPLAGLQLDMRGGVEGDQLAGDGGVQRGPER
ncbi:hypothetical protein, partial [Saccharothrix sp. ST-888]|uniref:hypothetical protein n=1 Tax=Saccharothrix sp. ST-888 TaxID=1427391 RepID=UPI000AD24D76